MHFDKESKRNNKVTKTTLLHAGYLCAHNWTGSICSNKTQSHSHFMIFFFIADIEKKNNNTETVYL